MLSLLRSPSRQLWLSLSTILLAFLGGYLSAAEGPEKDVRLLEPGKAIEREIAGGETHSYEVHLAAGQYVHVVVDQRGVDLVLILVEPDGKKSSAIDSPNGWWGPEEIFLIAPATGTYVIEVRPLDKEVARGRYEVKIEALRMANSADKDRAEAQKAYLEAEQLTSEQTAESLRRAIVKYEKAASLRRGAGDYHGEAIALLAAAGGCSALGEGRKALEFYKQALPVFRVVGGGELAAALVNTGVACTRLGEAQKALDNHKEALSIWRAIGDRAGEARTLNDLGVAYYSLGENDKAFGCLNGALPLHRAVGNRRGEAGTLHNLGVYYYSSGDFRKALVYLNEALPLRRSVGDRRGESYTLNRLGVVHDALGDRERALDYFSQALSLQRMLGDRTWETDTLIHIGTVYASFGEKQKALDHYKLALAISREVGDRLREAQTLSGVARVERDRDNLIEARKQIETALEIFDSLRSRVDSIELRASYFASAKGSYDLYVDILVRLHQREPSERFDELALKASENGRARTLLELLTESGAGIQQGVDPVLLERERSLRELISSKGELQIRMLSGRHSEEQAASAAKEIEGLKTEYEHVSGQIRSASPRYAALTQPQALGLSEIQKQVLDRDTVLLEYAQGDDRGYLWVATLDSNKVAETPKRSEIEAAARRFHDLLTARNRRMKFEGVEDRRARIARADAEYPKVATALSQMLLGPVAGELGSKRLLIVADGALQYVPFAALPSPTNPAVPLGAEHEIVSLPSASVLAVLRNEVAGRAPPSKTLAVLADPVFEKNDERLKGAGKVFAAQSTKAGPPSDSPLVRSAQDLGLEEGGQLRIPRLPFTRREAEGIFLFAPAMKRTKVLDFDANRAAATSEELGQYRFVHFATHGFLNSLHPELSGLVFSLVDRDGKDQDGFLPALEVYNLKLPVDLVVLSGCRTGLGKDVKGEGLVGLTRGFMYAGAARVLVSLWDVDDESTAELMTRFYRGMLGKQHLTPAAALRAAQVSIWKEKRWQAPYYWAAFTLQGEPN